MKKYIRIILVCCCIALGMVSCGKKELTTYTGNTYVYFQSIMSSKPTDSVMFSFSNYPSTRKDTTLMLPVKLMGVPRQQDCQLKVAVIDSGTTAIAGVHYTLPETIIIKAGEPTGFVPVKLLRSPDMVADTFVLRLQLKTNEYFSADMQDKVVNAKLGTKLSYTTFKIKVSDVTSPPKLWDKYYYDEFSPKKYFTMMDELEITVDDFNNTANLPNVETGPLQVYWATYMGRWLKDKQVAKDTVFEADNTTPMKMGAAYN